MVLGSHLFALAPTFMGSAITKWGDRGMITLPELTSMRESVFIAIAAPALVGVLVLLELFAP
jgi:hypothetical protein